jgi:hypothetical protein
MHDGDALKLMVLADLAIKPYIHKFSSANIGMQTAE